MSLHEYQESQKISAQDPPFYALIMAAFRKADTDNRRKLQRAFPFRFQEFLLRYHAPGGLLEGEQFSEPQEYSETIMGIPVKVVESTSEPMNLVLGSFNDYDHRKKKEAPKLPSSWDPCTDEELEVIAKEL